MSIMSKDNGNGAPKLIKIKATETGEAVLYFAGKYFAKFDSVTEAENDPLCKCESVTEMVRQVRERSIYGN